MSPRIEPTGEPTEEEVERVAWRLCPILRACDEEDMPVILNGPYVECRKCKMRGEHHGGTAGCRLTAGVVAHAAIAALRDGET